MSQATLRTGRLVLAPLAERHLPHEIELDADPEVMRHLGPPRTREEVVARHRERLAVAARTPGLGFWAGHLGGANGASSGNGEEGEFVGWWILEPPERAGHGHDRAVAEIGYRLLPRFWRRGLASEGARELLRHGFDDLGLSRVFAETMAVNEASRATMRSIGLSHVRTFHPGWDHPLPGSEHGEVEYATTRARWLASGGR
ncbi:GNAT family N-acetyltransferase [Pseudonocardia sp. HH130630-07]|uniref:GNAT family N-acetyltransferase n=1 Tax=Pseudonocardia sp. HH130630-07 TaxID=1690815 RepID=UPI000814CF62|nr:GNAT family N-acetyltransferase [Pseudonocardia sp. HH130630-07]ANY10448.1 GCN5 family acetyltransferase [Pseudonocardia sp. HH130630-07]